MNDQSPNLSDVDCAIFSFGVRDDVSNDYPLKPPLLFRSQSAVKERICSLNLNDKGNSFTERCRFNTFGHGTDGMSRSIYVKHRSRTLPLTLLNNEKQSNDATDQINEKEYKVTDETKTYNDSKWTKVVENGQEVYIQVNTGDKWYSTTDECGRQYFYSALSRQSSWKLPEENLKLERSIGDDAVRTIEEVLEGVEESSESDLSFTHNSSDCEDINQMPLPSPYIPVVRDGIFSTQEDSSRFDIRHIKKEHISGPLFNKLMRTERSGNVEKAKISENGKEVSKKWSSFHIILTGPELLFYKDVKATNLKPGLPQGKFELKLKIQNLQFSEKRDASSKGCVLQVEDTGAPGSNITYLLRYPSPCDMKAWKVALELAKDWQNENLYTENMFNCDSAVVEDVTGDRQNIGLKLKQFLKKRPTRESLELRGILKPESVFGSSLDILCEQEKTLVPEFVFRSILAIEARGLHHNGLYRISGNQAKIQKLRLAVDENKYQLNSEFMELETLTGAFKLFFKELKEPLFDEIFCRKMVEILSHRKPDKKNPFREVSFSSAKKLVLKMKSSHHATTKSLIGHLYKVAGLSQKNLMDVSNLSMVWGPNLYTVSGQASTKLAIILMTHNQIIEFLITYYCELFERP